MRAIMWASRPGLAITASVRATIGTSTGAGHSSWRPRGGRRSRALAAHRCPGRHPLQEVILMEERTMTTEMATVTTEKFHRWMHDHHMYGLWELASQMTARPMPEMRAWMWQWSLLESIVKQSGEVIPVGEERRALQLFNPGLGGQWATTPTLIAAVQLLLPGEVARAHRHTPTAIRFILEGSGAYTAVEGERVYMEPGDLILTPNWQWHDHGNETDHPVVWLDGLDIPLVRALNAMFFELHPERQAPVTKPRNASQALYGYGRLSPTWVKERPQASPLLLYSWDQTLAALQALRDREGSPYEGIILEF